LLLFIVIAVVVSSSTPLSLVSTLLGRDNVHNLALFKNQSVSPAQTQAQTKKQKTTTKQKKKSDRTASPTLMLPPQGL
jgi:hypothetical protein